MALRLPADTPRHVHLPVTVYDLDADERLDLTDDDALTVQIAFPSAGEEPSSGDWEDAEAVDAREVRVLADLAEGSYDMHRRVSDYPQEYDERVGPVVVG